ncbi:hypothetical protein ABBQ32_003676 [Trebouxia sp. C0010 RCD-2024]
MPNRLMIEQGFVRLPPTRAGTWALWIRVLPMMNRFSPGIMFVYNTSCDSERRCRGHALALTRPYLRH